MDKKYLDAEGEGRAENSAAYFALARLMSALSLANEAARLAPTAPAPMMM
ncbi:hypothetical protein HGP16_32515 [Rhizobium sp. P40RR-XXII]|nr:MULTISPECIES: hypothetical protein [unclassified Rhizobium]NLR89354.1 hypothetical protein [Rhizobium sp. P28RR-XV]NLS21224.1 hypothetical protein [Rhizobium sp. P40RR-XXII]